MRIKMRIEIRIKYLVFNLNLNKEKLHPILQEQPPHFPNYAYEESDRSKITVYLILHHIEMDKIKKQTNFLRQDDEV